MWLLEEGSAIELPAIQRGFVWRTAQIENLWDSILRGYPVGAFLLSSNGDHLDLFDGQQRATSIALGFYNPWEKHKDKARIGNDKSLPTVWLDLDPAVKPEGSTYLVRVLTKSHPWGYLARNNSTGRIQPIHRSCATERYFQLVLYDIRPWFRFYETIPGS